MGDKEVKGKEVCVVCGDNMPKTILQKHHLNPYNKSEGKIWLCASCHNIFNKIKENTKLDEVKRDLNLRHRGFTNRQVYRTLKPNS
jgi:Zn-finger protein